MYSSHLPHLIGIAFVIGTSFSPFLAENASAQDTSNREQLLRVVIMSELPEAITYYDQGFSDFIRESKSVPVDGISLASIVTDSIVRELAIQGYKVTSIAPPPEFKQARAELIAAVKSKTFAPSLTQEMRLLLSRLRDLSVADALIIVSPGKTSSERFIEGMAVMTKIGLLGIEKLSIVFTMPRIEVYSIERSTSCTTLSPVGRKRIPAIYSNWKTDMAEGPSSKLAAEMQGMVAQDLPLQLAEALSTSVEKLSNCFRSR